MRAERMSVRLVLSVCLILASCGQPGAPADGGVDGDANPACPSAAGTYAFTYTCSGGAGGSGGFLADITQVDCTITLTEMDDRTPMTWTSTGALASDGTFTLSGEFGFSSTAACTGAITGSALSMTCDTCDVMAMRQ